MKALAVVAFVGALYSWSCTTPPPHRVPPDPIPAPTCGNGVLDPALPCDADGFDPGAVCDHGIARPAEECDDGPLNSDTWPDACRTTCVLPWCGDGVWDSTEECDPGRGKAHICNPNCTISRCGDGIVNADAAEQCDTRGESADCDADCTLVECGDGITNRHAGECDAGSVFPNGVCENCLVKCDAGFGECDGDLANGCEHNLLDDAAQCGRCGHSCLDAPCVAGACVPVLVASAAGTADVLRFESLSVDGDTLYWSSEGRIFRATKGATNQTGEAVLQGLGSLKAMVALAGTVYFIGPSAAGGSQEAIFAYTPGVDVKPRAIGVGLEHPSDLDSSGQSLCWSELGSESKGYADGHIVRYSPATGEQATVVSDITRPFRLRADGETYCWVDPGPTPNPGGWQSSMLWRAAGGVADFVNNGADVWFVTCREGNVFWLDQGTKVGLDDMVVIAPPGGFSQARVAHQTAPAGLAVGDPYVYWGSSAHGELRYTTIKKPGPPRVLTVSPAPIVWMTIDGPYLYWLDTGNHVFRAAR